MSHVQWIQTTQDSPWQTKGIEKAGNCGNTLELDGHEFQQLKGFGGCFNELGWRSLQRMRPEDREEVLEKLFSPKECNLLHNRMPIGASDYARDWYSLNDTPGDYAMEHFTIERDKGYLLCYVKEAMKYQPEMTLFISPWSPPAWMKYPPVYNYGTLVWDEKNLKGYARYLRLAVEKYQEAGIPVCQLHVQNEPAADQKFPSCLWTGEQFRVFIGEYLGPEFRQHDVKAEIWLGTVNGPGEIGERDWNGWQYSRMAHTVLLDENARRYIAGVGYQWGGKHALAQTHAAYPGLRLMQTENECGNGHNSWDFMEYVFGLLWHYFRNGVEAYTYWNMVLDDGGESTWGWHQNSMVTVSADGEAVYQPEYYLMRHFSHFVRPGAVLLGLKGHEAGNALAFRNPDGSVVIELMNCLDTKRQVDLLWNGERCPILMDGHSIHTVKLNDR